MCWRGDAGSGKTYLVDVLRQILLPRGWKIRGVAPTGAAAANLHEESRIPAVTLAAFLAYYEGIKRRRSADSMLIVVDESSMIGITDMARLTRVCERLGMNLLLIGDPSQLTPLTAGDPFTNLCDFARGAGVLVELHENFRQRHSGLRHACDLARARNMPASLGALRDLGWVREIGPPEERWAEIARLFRPGMLVISPSALSCMEINRRIREKLFPLRLRRAAVKFRARRKRSEFDVEILPGDRIVCTKNLYGRLNLRNGFTGTVADIGRDRFTVRLDGGRTVEINPALYPWFDHGYAVTTWKAQGRTVGTVLIDADTTRKDLETMRAQYVQITRARDFCLIFTDDWENLLFLARLGQHAETTLSWGWPDVTLEECLARRETIRQTVHSELLESFEEPFEKGCKPFPNHRSMVSNIA
ncbi:MAG: hypothetical protein A3G34_15240 [Candidatus Lindowbacteria bacterium RIFCSPLOWO2_12_FULL_62_27]|nr:MAG: hypothetical protein A3G34_15240 [Candidatus Lindowbacteria bacterium RIFCSPLOWO2_12_FULL_62_27]OGH63879.1 MAG: hypothetical protein A3I06_06220 [Candidatus Lindowbacteria bacterium RIFCSPLOWO2_02_FULL_62_12]